jgi:hypothetical protein
MATESPVMSLYQTFKPLFVASFAAVAVLAASWGAQPGFPINVWAVGIVVAWMCGLTLAGVLLFVLPVLAILPKLRRPSIWLAAGWGALTACAYVGLIFGRPYKLYGPQALVVFAATGAVAGVCYALLVRRQPGAMR